MATRDAAVPLAAGLPLVVLVQQGKTNAFDEAVTRRIEVGATPAVRALLHLAAQPGFPPLSRVLPAAAIAVAARMGGRRQALMQALA